MFKLVFHIWLVKLAFTTESSEILETLNLISTPIVSAPIVSAPIVSAPIVNAPIVSAPILRAPSPKKLDLNESCFSSLHNYQVLATSAKESSYPWIARVIHSRSADIPHVCTAVCIDKAIFITAARCIYTLKVRHTTIMYLSKRFEARVFVEPSKPTRQMFDDIGFIVVDTKKVKLTTWKFINLFNVVNRTDEVFQWFANLNKKGNIKYKVVGYAMLRSLYRLMSAERKYDLTELNVVAAHDICFKILQKFRKKEVRNGFGVPCYHSCSYEQFDKNDTQCKRYHGVEGGALIDATTSKLIGIATWGAHYYNREMPVGFSTVNSENFFKDLKCARRIRDDNGTPTKGYYQKLCDGKK